MKRIIKEYFTFSKKERIAVCILLVLMSGFIAAPYLYQPKTEMPVMKKELVEFLAGGSMAAGDSITDRTVFPPVNTVKRGIVMFSFDPNTVGEDDWLRLGISAKTIRTILNYRSKGGKFRSPEDIRKIWGMKKEDADRLIPYISIQGNRVQGTGDKFLAEKNTVTQQSTYKQTAGPIDINIADVEQWKSLPGIGDVLANRIVKFRDKIGGFVSLEQVRKTYGISDSLFPVILPYLRFEPANLPKLNLNTASLYDLRSRTGMPYSMAKSIISFREQNGPYQSLEDIKKAFPIPDTLWQKLVLLIKNE